MITTRTEHLFLAGMNAYTTATHLEGCAMATEAIRHTTSRVEEPMRRSPSSKLLVGGIVVVIVGLLLWLGSSVSGNWEGSRLWDQVNPLVGNGARWEEALRTGQVVTVEVVVRPGDTLWQIASTYGPPGRDVREVVDWIRHVNGLTSGTLQVGQILAVPTTPTAPAP